MEDVKIKAELAEASDDVMNLEVRVMATIACDAAYHCWKHCAQDVYGCCTRGVAVHTFCLCFILPSSWLWDITGD